MNIALLSIARRATDTLMWIFQNPRLAAEAILVVALVVGGWMYNRQQKKLAEVQLEKGQLSDGLREQISIRDGQIEILRKQKGKVTREVVYVPVESPVIIQNPDDPSKPIVVITKDKGFTFRPGFGVEWANNGLSPRLDIKWAYYKRWSLLTGGGKGGVDLSISRHLDDIIWGHPRNIEIFGGYKFFRMPGSGSVVMGLRANF